jgi:hypothetical protein
VQLLPRLLRNIVEPLWDLSGAASSLYQSVLAAATLPFSRFETLSCHMAAAYQFRLSKAGHQAVRLVDALTLFAEENIALGSRRCS